jgi:hypothetical protein
MKSFIIVRASRTVSIDNGYVDDIDCSSLASNISFVLWTEEDGGTIEYLDRPAVQEPFIDIGPYQPFINAWIAAVEHGSPPLTLAQAKTIKSDFVDALWQQKRTAPYPHNVAAGNYTWSARDEDLYGMTSEYVSNSIPTHQWAPIGSGPVGLSDVEMRAIINGITIRRLLLDQTRVEKHNAINALTSIAAVIAYDATAGW